MSLALARVDDRLVHGQVVLAWGGSLDARRLLVADDAVAENAWERELMQTVAEGLEIEVFPVEECPARLAEEGTRSGAAILLLRTPAAALRAVDAGAGIRELNLGGLHYAPGKERVLDYLYLDGDDREALRALIERGVAVTARDVPNARPVEAHELLADGNAE